MYNAVIQEAQTSPFQLQKPDYVKDTKDGRTYIFVVGYLSFGAEECVHLTPEVLSERMTKRLGPGHLTFDGTDLWWHTDSGMIDLQAIVPKE